MRVLEFHFNPKLRPYLIFDSFCYEPGNVYEKRMGGLYLTGVLKNILPQNLNFLNKLTKVIQKEYYRSTIIKPEKALKESLKEANEFLEQIAKKGDVSWLGNLSFAALSFKNYQLNFAKVGDLKIFLLRGGKVIDIDQKLKYEEILPWPLKVFGNIASGKLTQDDVILISSKEVTDFLKRENLLPEIAKLEPVNEKGVKEIFDKKKEGVLKISGLCLALILTKEAIGGEIAESPFRPLSHLASQSSTKQVITPQTYPKEFKLKEAFAPFINFFAKARKSLYAWLKGLIKKPRLRLPDLEEQAKSGKFPKLTVPKLSIPKLPLKFLVRNKKLILIPALIFLLFFGFFIAQFKEGNELKEGQNVLQEIQEKVNQAESFLILKETRPEVTKEANLLLKESWEEISQLSEIASNLPKDFQSRVSSLKDKISGTLLELNKLEIVEEPELFFDFDHREFIPHRMVFFKDELYFFSPYSQNLFEVDKNTEGQVIEIAKTFNLAATLDDSILFFSEPNQITALSRGGLYSTVLEEPHESLRNENSVFSGFAVYAKHLYFLDKNSGEIIRYPHLEDFKWGSPQMWLEEKEEKVIEAKSMAIDGSIWVLDKNNSLGQYYRGGLEEKINPEIFPEPKDFKKIFTSPALPYFYLLESVQERIVIIDKEGLIIKQFQSQKFDNLLDFAISEDGETIYLLNGLKVYQIKL